jgi:hypothetical protein
MAIMEPVNNYNYNGYVFNSPDEFYATWKSADLMPYNIVDDRYTDKKCPNCKLHPGTHKKPLDT